MRIYILFYSIFKAPLSSKRKELGTSGLRPAPRLEWKELEAVAHSTCRTDSLLGCP